MNKYIVIIICLVTITNFPLWSQPVNHQIGDVTMPSAEAASLGKYGDIPTNYFTGVSSSGIPIGAVQQGPLSQAVSLSYHNSGVKVAELASNVGLNWSLQAGGMISRTVNGLPDEDAEGWLFRDVNTPVSAENISTVDTEPDVFNLSIPGYSYKFVFENQAGQNPDAIAKTIPESDVEIHLIRNGGIRGFRVVLPDGTVCYFGTHNGSNVTERNTTQGGTIPVEQLTGWYLLRKESADGNHFIDFEYERDEYRFQSPSSAEKFTVQYNSASCGTNTETGFKYLSSNNSFYTTNDIWGYRIKRITTSSGKQEINFSYGSSSRQDVEVISSYQAKPLEKIEVKSGAFTKVFRLQHSYFQSPTTLYTTTNGADGHLKRLKLDALHEEDALGNASGSYQFEYYGTNGDLPNRLSHAVDSWGFYNGKTANDDNPVNVPRTVLSNANQVYGSSDRDSDGTHMVKGSLKKITYPTGGSVEYELEANRYEFSSFENFSYETRNFVSTIYNFEAIEDPANYGCVSFTERGPDFALTEEEISTAIVEIDFIDILMDFTNCTEDQRVFTCKLFTKTGQLIKEFGFNESIDMDWPVQSRTLLDWLDLGPSALSAGEYYFEITGTYDPVELKLLVRPANVEKEVGGLRTKSIIKRDIDGSILDEIYFDYTREGSELSSAYLYNSPVYGATIQSNQYTNVFFREMSITPLADFNGYHVGYERVTVSKPNNGKTVYIYDVEPSESPFLFPQVPDEYLSYNGLLREEHHYEQGASNAVSSKTTSYSNNYTDIISNAQKYFVHRESDPFSGSSCLVVAARTYTVRTAPQLVSTVTSTMDGLTTSTTHSYRFDRRHLMPYHSVTIHPDGTVEEVETDFVADLSSPTAVYLDMEDRNMVHIPIESRRFINDIQVGGTKTDYSLIFDGFPRPLYVKNWNADLGNYQVELTFNSYDAKGNPNQITQRGWQSETFTWDDDQLLTRQFDNFIWTYAYYPASRMLQRYTEPNGLFTTYNYDAFMRLESINQYNGKSITNLDYQFHSVAGINKVTTSITHTDGADFTSEVEFDGLGRKILARKVGYGHNNQNVVTKVEYDQLGRLFKEYAPGFGSTPGAATTYTYEPSPLNRISQVTPPAPLGPTTYAYGSENNLFYKTETNALGQINKTYTDTRGRMRKMVAGKSPELAETNYYYDDRDNLQNIVPPGRSLGDVNYIYSYTYDGRNNVLSKKIPEKALVEMRYDQRDQMTHYKDGIHPVVYTNYDVFGRVNQTGFVSSLSDVSIATADLLSDMDYVTNPSAPGFGQGYYSKIALLDPMGAPTGQFIESQTLAWDAYERPTSKAGNHPLNLPGLTSMTSNTVYNDLDQVKSVSTTVQVGSDSWSTVSSSTYDHSGRLLVENFNFDGVQKEVSRVGAYDVWDNVTTKVLGGNLQTINYGFYANGFLQSINSPLSGSITARSNATLNINSNADLFSMGLTYDVGGNIQTWTYQNRGFAPETNTYTYDGLNRIKTNTTASGLRNQSFSYRDLLGNIGTLERFDLVPGTTSWTNTQIDDLTYTYETVKSSKLLSIQDASNHEAGYKPNALSYTYDANGNMTFDPQKGFTLDYNHLNLPSAITSSNGSKTETIYDAAGYKWQRIRTDQNGQAQTRTYVAGMEFLGTTLEMVKHAGGYIQNNSYAATSQLVLSGDAQQDETAQNISSSQIVSLGKDITYTVGDEIVMGDGFEASEGSEFLATTAILNTTPNYEWRYTIQDHLGNTRVVFTDKNGDGLIRQSSDENFNEVLSFHVYSPFGLELSGSHQNNSGSNFRYRYNGKELDEATGYYSYGAREYDASIGRFFGVDPIIEEFPWVTPYNYAENEPVGSIDLWGLQQVRINDLRNDRGDIVSRNVTFSITLNIINVSSKDDSALSSYKISSSTLNSRADRSFSTSFIGQVVDGKSGRMTENAIPITVSFDLSTKINGTINSTDFVTAFVDDLKNSGTENFREGVARLNNNIALVEADQLDAGGNAQEIILHELGHSLGLDFSLTGGDIHTKDGKGLMGENINGQFGVDKTVLKLLYTSKYGTQGSAELDRKHSNTASRLMKFIKKQTNAYDENKAKKRGL